MTRIYHPWNKWEDNQHGFHGGMDYPKDNTLKLYADLLRDLSKFEAALKTIITEWKYSCEHNLSNESMNRVAYLGQAYGDDQRRGLWLYHILEPATWYKVVARVNGVNSGALYIQETGNITGYAKITKPDNHTWKSFCNLLLSSLPKATQDHYIIKFKVFLKWWKLRGYPEGIPDEAPLSLEAKRIAPSYRRLCKVLLRNDYWCKGLAFTQPKSAAYGKYLELKKSGTLLKVPAFKEDEG